MTHVEDGTSVSYIYITLAFSHSPHSVPSVTDLPLFTGHWLDSPFDWTRPCD